jgi:uncharacterized protein (TIRG00374 family)
MRVARVTLRILVSLLVSAAFVWLSLRHTDLRAVGRAVLAADPRPVATYLFILLVVHLVRTVRWGLLLEPLGHVGFRRLNSASAIGFMMLMVLPLRLGELARPVLVSRTPSGGGPQLRRSGAMASCVVERVIDGLAVGVLGIVALRLLGARATGSAADFARHASWVVTGGFLALCAALVAAFFMRQRAVSLVRRCLSLASRRLADRAASMLEAFTEGLHLGSGVRVLCVLGLTVVHWALHVIGFALLAPSFGFALTSLMSCAVLASQVVGVMVPAGPGMVGTSQFFTQAGLAIFVPGALTAPAVAVRAAGYANTIWILQFGQQVLLGLLFWMAGRVSLAGLVRPQAEESTV